MASAPSSPHEPLLHVVTGRAFSSAGSSPSSSPLPSSGAHARWPRSSSPRGDSSPKKRSSNSLGGCNPTSLACIIAHPLLLAALLLLLSNYCGHYCLKHLFLSARHGAQELFVTWPPGDSSGGSSGGQAVESSEQINIVLGGRLEAGGSRSEGFDLVPSVASAGEEQKSGRMGSPYLAEEEIDVVHSKRCASVMYQARLQKGAQHFASNAAGSPISFVGDLVNRNERLLLSMPRHGLGNSLRGFVSAFVYAQLAGRRMVRFHGAEHSKVYDALCSAFSCGFDAIRWDENSGGHMGVYRQLEKLQPRDFLSAYKTSLGVRRSIASRYPLFVSKSPHLYDGFWQNAENVKSCVYEAFKCSSTWCVHSRAMQALLGPPTPVLMDTIQKILFVNKNEEEEEAAVWREGDMFDIAIHLRTRTDAIESTKKGSKENAGKVGCTDSSTEAYNSAVPTAQGGNFLRRCLWTCMGSLLGKLSAKKGGRRLQILLATDNEALRPAFVDQLQAHGDVFFSRGNIVHSSKSASSADSERLPTMAEFYLMGRSHVLLEAGNYISTFAYFASLSGNGTLAGINWKTDGSCDFQVVHKGQLRQ